MKTKRIKYQNNLINGAYYEKKNTVPNAIHPTFNSMEHHQIRSNGLNALFVIRRLYGQIKKIKNIIKNTGSNFGYMTAIPWMIYQRYQDIAPLKSRTSFITGLIRSHIL